MAVLRCKQCNKPFDKESTLKRHGYYCRSRKLGSILRARSCLSCAKGKAQCDNRRPACSRCAAKAVECHYPASPSNVSVSKNSRDNNAIAEHHKVDLPSTANLSRASGYQRANNGDSVIDTAIVTPSDPFAYLDGDNFNWSSPNIDFTDFFAQPHYDKTAFMWPSPSPFSTISIEQAMQLQQTFSHDGMLKPESPFYSSRSRSRSIIQRPKGKPGLRRVADLILHILKSYLVIMQQKDTLPPFIHPSLIFSDAENGDMEPLTNCISLVHMISRQVPGGRKLFWNNVRQECERLHVKHLELNRWQLLAAMQALSIYILIRLEEGETDHNNFDSLLVSTVTLIARQTSLTEMARETHLPLHSHDLKASWNDWLFEESKRRLCVIYQVVNMLFYFEPAAMCEHPADLVLAPLPSRKQLWEAGDELAWKAESAKSSGIQADFGLAANGDLVKLGECRVYCGDGIVPSQAVDVGVLQREAANWEEWCSGMDSFGGLIMLAASLTG